jgi:hypothetical protein
VGRNLISSLGSLPGPAVSTTSRLRELTTFALLLHYASISLTRGVSGDDPAGGARCGVPEARPYPRPGRFGTSAAPGATPGRRGCPRERAGGNSGHAERGAGPKSPGWSAERPVPVCLGTAASRKRGVAPYERDRNEDTASRRSSRPSVRGRRRELKRKQRTRGQNAPRERKTLPADAKAMAGLPTCPPKLQRRRVRCLTL